MIDAHERYFSRNLEKQSNSRTLPVFRNIGWGPLSCALWCGYAFTSSEPLAPAVPSSSLLPLDITWLASQCLGVADVARIRALFGIDDQRVPRPGDAVRPEMRHDVNNPSAGAPGPASSCIVHQNTIAGIARSCNSVCGMSLGRLSWARAKFKSTAGTYTSAKGAGGCLPEAWTSTSAPTGCQ
jgi:hypothetical protein